MVRPGDARYSTSFGIPQEDISTLYYRSDEKPLPRKEIQLRMFLLDITSEQHDAFPPNCVVKMDDYNVTLPVQSLFFEYILEM
jgi:hypothetical protein